MTYIKTIEEVVVENYPYSFRLRTTLTNSMEFNPKKGYRQVTQTINPKTGRVNATKKSTYYPLLVRFYDENNYIQTKAFDFNGDAEINKGLRFVAENFDLFTPDEVKYLYEFIYSMGIVDMKATAIYGGSNIEELKPLYENFFKLGKEGMESGSNLFGQMLLDSDAIEATKPKDYNPFVRVG